ncbi:MAG TPA: transglycosylase family protein [Pseudonocardia sp.]|nr:transglycosylase family protein [Pseudonocardia sp.]
MARYRGRHRAPGTLGATTGRALARTALAGAVAGAPLLVAAPAASAASDATWDRLAECESGGRWDIDTGNGYHGGLQFSPRTWTAFGGGEFAPVAHQASREQQIVVAERVLAGQGWRAWPACSRKLGLGEGPTPRSAPAPAQQVRASAPAPTSTSGEAATSGNYKVRSGDTLSSIAAQHGVAGGWQALARKNPALANPDLIFPGQRITL